eukprot:scaffold2088_cov399-Prasinococcus_capsulatus_cf.AAC.47
MKFIGFFFMRKARSRPALARTSRGTGGGQHLEESIPVPLRLGVLPEGPRHSPLRSVARCACVEYSG